MERTQFRETEKTLYIEIYVRVACLRLNPVIPAPGASRSVRQQHPSQLFTAVRLGVCFLWYNNQFVYKLLVRTICRNHNFSPGDISKHIVSFLTPSTHIRLRTLQRGARGRDTQLAKMKRRHDLSDNEMVTNNDALSQSLLQLPIQILHTCARPPHQQATCPRSSQPVTHTPTTDPAERKDDILKQLQRCCLLREINVLPTPEKRVRFFSKSLLDFFHFRVVHQIRHRQALLSVHE